MTYCCWLLLATALAATAFVLIPSSRSLPPQPGIDFSHYWGVARVRAQRAPERANPYRYVRDYNVLAHRLAQTSGDRAWQQANALRAHFDLTNTPLLYSAAALYPARYTVALTLHRRLECGWLLLGTGLLLHLTGGFGLARVVGVVLLGAACAPVSLDLQVANVAGLQFAGIVIAIVLARAAAGSRLAACANLLWLPLATLLKPNFVLVNLLLWLATVRALPPSLRVAGLAATLVGAAAGSEIGSHFFAAPSIWFDWLQVIFSQRERLAYDYELGNFSTALWLAHDFGVDLQHATIALFAGISLALLASTAANDDRRDAWLSCLPTADTALQWASVGVIITLASAPLVWQHYYVLALIPGAFLLLQPGLPAAARVFGACGVLGAAGSLRLLAVTVFAPDWPPLRALDCLTWLPLAAGLMVAGRAVHQPQFPPPTAAQY